MSIFDNKTVLITGAAGICGHAAIKRLLQNDTVKIRATVFNTRKIQFDHPNLEIVRVDLTSYEDCQRCVKGVDIVLNFAAFISGAKGQMEYKVDLVRRNIVPTVNMMDAAVKEGVEYFGFIGSSTMYPGVDYPVEEQELFDLEPFPAYAGVGWMKRYSQKVIELFQSVSNTKFGVVIPSAIYGPYDNFNEKGHVIPQLIMKSSVKMNPFEVWGDGKQVRQFIYVDDLIDALFYVLENDPSGSPYNVRTGGSITITELAEKINEICNHDPEYNYDVTKPTMILKRQVNIDKITKLGWRPKNSLEDGLRKTIAWYEENK